MQMLVVSSCGKKKKVQPSTLPTCDDLSSTNWAHWKTKLNPYILPAAEMYTGNQFTQLLVGVERLRRIKGFDIDVYIVSAGFGLLSEQDLIPPYECSFSAMKKGEILSRADTLGIQDDFAKLMTQGYDFSYLALGKSYMTAIGFQWLEFIHGTIASFVKEVEKEGILYLPANANTVHEFSANGHKIHGVTGFKGDLLRILADYALSCVDPLEEVKNWTNTDHLLNLVKSFAKARS